MTMSTMSTTSTTVLWLDPQFGASGDMLLGALVGAGAEVDAVRAGLGRLPFGGWELSTSEVTRGGISGTRVEVHVDDRHEDHGRRWRDIDTMLASSDLPGHVRDGARSTFRRLGEVEAAAHRVAIDEVHFHEVGAVDAIVDIVGAWIALDLLAVNRVIIGPVGLGRGMVRGHHGLLPLPAPATAALLAGAPVRAVDVEMETCTPTGAALLATIGTWGPLPAGVLEATARGAGGRDPASHPNVLTAHLVEVEDAAVSSSPAPGGAATEAVVLETNLDDVTPEVVAHAIDRLLAAGADDAWVTPILMKKSRPAFTLCVLTSPACSAELRALIHAETGTLGIRESTVTKHVVPRHVEMLDVDGVSVRVKVGPHGAKPEHDDLVALSSATGRPLRELAAEVLRRWLQQVPDTPAD